MKLFLDANVIVDIVRYREPYVYDAMPILQMGVTGIHKLLLSDLTFANVAYLTRKNLSLLQWYEMLADLRSNVQIVMVGAECIDAALRLQANDLEDAIQFFSAKQAKTDCIITRNKKDFLFSDIPVLDPREFLTRY